MCQCNARAYHRVVLIMLLESRPKGRMFGFWSVKNYEERLTQRVDVPAAFRGDLTVTSNGARSRFAAPESRAGRHPFHLFFQPFDAVTGREHAANGPRHEESR